MHLTRLVALVACAALAMAGCTDAGGATIADPDEVTLGDTEVAFYLSRDTAIDDQKDSAEEHPGYLVLVQPDGSYELVETSGMEEAHIAWSESGLFFSDDARDHILDNSGLVSLANKKPGLQQAALALAGDKGYVAVYNDGFTESGYSNKVAVTTATDAELYQVEGNYYTNAVCDGVVYGIAPEVGSHLPKSAKIAGMRSKADPGAQPELLAQLYPPTNGHEKVLGWRAAFDAADLNRHVPCQDGVITFLSDYVDADGDPHMTVVSWNTSDGKYTEEPLVDGDGRPIVEDLVDAEEFATKFYDARALRGGHLEWLAGDGRILSTDVTSGVTTPRFDTGLSSDTDSFSQAAFTDRSIHVIQETFDGETPVKIKRFDRATGKLDDEIAVSGLAERLGIEFNLRGMAVPPTA